MKNRFKIYCLFIVLFHFSLFVQAQNEQETFLQGKQYLNEGKYNFAMQSFEKLAIPDATHAFKEYASFYYALAAYKNYDFGLARSMWLQMESKYPQWKKIQEVYYWLSEVYFQEGNLEKGTYYAKKSNLSDGVGVIDHYLSEVDDVLVLKSIYEAFSDDKNVAMALVAAIDKQPLFERDFDLIKQLTEKFNFGQSLLGFSQIGESVKKDFYRVAVLLPFMFEGLDDTRRVERNTFVMDLYHGIVQATGELNLKNKLIEVFPYDTKRDKRTTANILRQEELKSMDLIIGPLYPEPSKLTSSFCFENKINMINPVSSNSVITGDNPYSFLFKPTHEVQALKAAEFAIDTFQSNKKNTYIFFDDEKDSIMADLYAKKIKEADFEIAGSLKIDDEKVQFAYELLTETYEQKLSEEEADSISKIEGRIVKESMPKSKNDSAYFYEEHFVIEKDSIGHIFLASSKPLHASLFISAVEIRGDNIPIVGRYDWLKDEMLTIDQMERLGVYFISPDYVLRNSPAFLKFRRDYQKEYREMPSMNSMLGYEVMMYTGEMMKKYGHYFQRGALQEGFVPGKLFYGIDYKIFNSNQVVPITQFINSELQLVNAQYDIKEE
ncbi:hypothetical protein [Reichenbachiella sp. MALMAid0571]|uniref:ABC transporter substrate-binding protein n=1 Tax=Reichenbachiella sp. MALMAid0571 TaxID=3143939 RepID=UPI0032DEBAAE